ncbi:HNH endonuclease signature motif containing protein, partial [Bdellovibrionota bacterium FG-2]
HELKMVISDEVYQKLQQIKGLLAHAKPNGTMSELLEYLVNETLPRLEKKKGIATETTAAAKVPAAAAPAKALPAGQRVYLSVSVRREVFLRAQGRCEYIYQGRRCTSRFALELDHIHPLALGGANERENFRVLCKCHNLQQAQAKLGEFKKAGAGESVKRVEQRGLRVPKPVERFFYPAQQ